MGSPSARRFLLVVCAALVACGGGEPPTLEQRFEMLRDCPAGDKPWRDALAQADGEERLTELLTLAQGVALTCPNDWEPAWIAGECLIRMNPPEARPHFETALGRARSTNDPVGIACAANRLGQFGYFTGELKAGEEHYLEAIAAAGRAGRADLAAFARSNLAALLLERGEYVNSRNELERAAATFAELELDHAVQATEFNRGVVLLELGDAVAAREALERVHARARDAGDSMTLHQSAVALGNLEFTVGARADAKRWYTAGVGGPAGSDALAHLGLGRIALAEGRFVEAAQLLEHATAQARKRERLFALIAEALWAEAEMLAGETTAARARLERVIEQSDERDAEESSWAGRWILGKLLMREQRWAEAIAPLEQAIEILERQQATLDPRGDGLYFLRERADPYVDLAVAIVRDQAPDRAARVMQLASRAKMRTLRRLSRAGEGGGTLTTELAAVRAALLPGELLLDYLVGAERAVLLAVSRADVRAIPLPGRNDLDAALRAFNASLRNAGAGTGTAEIDRDAGHALRAALLDPVADLLEQTDRLYVVPDRELALIPFGALPWNDGFLLDTHDIATMPLAGPPPRWSGTSRGPVLLAGQPTGTEPEFPELAWAAYELSELREVWGARATLLHGDAFTHERLVETLGSTDYATLHLATHAEASTHDPRRCGVVLSGGGRLGLDEIAGGGIKLPPDSLVVLSACRTGVGELVPGEGVIGLGWSFLQTGARAIVVSHWSVDDAAAARLMVGFHKRLADGAEPVAALSAAARELRAVDERYEHPAYWAPFVIQLRP